ncbi:MAG: hypothetical protein LBI17_03195 [Rickettsiales bacterium]|jgi:hypothetical protein|nr:hypothetical protein [Rickettsiales bacterium]
MKKIFFIFSWMACVSCSVKKQAIQPPPQETPSQREQRENREAFERRLQERREAMQREEQELADDIASGQCMERRMPKVAEKSKGYCNDLWEPLPYGDTPEEEAESIKKYPSWKICECFAERWVEKMPEQLKEDLAQYECSNNKTWGYGVDAFKESLYQFAGDIWQECDKEVPRWVEDMKDIGSIHENGTKAGSQQGKQAETGTAERETTAAVGVERK